MCKEREKGQKAESLQQECNLRDIWLPQAPAQDSVACVTADEDKRLADLGAKMGKKQSSPPKASSAGTNGSSNILLQSVSTQQMLVFYAFKNYLTLF